MLLQFTERERRVHRYAVVDHMQVGLLKVDHPLAARVLHVGITNIPLARDSPVENRRPGRNLVDAEGDVLLDSMERLAKAIARDTAAKRIELGHEPIHL